jgi:hypothetical protein
MVKELCSPLTEIMAVLGILIYLWRIGWINGFVDKVVFYRLNQINDYEYWFITPA